MDIVTRIKTFISASGLTVSQFADTSEIPRPTVSQLLNGRNKKVSDEIITKIHNAYPRLSISWLLFGEGVMFLEETAVNLDENEKSLTMDKDDVENPNLNEFSFGDLPFFDGLNPSNSALNKPEMQSIKDVDENTQKIFQGLDNDINTRLSSDKKVVSIIVFYSDNSFESFKPASASR